MHSGGEKEWKCQQCGFAFWEKGDLIRHIKSHEGNRPLKCDFCEQTFVWKRYLYKHLNNHHKAEDKHFCKTCLACLPSEEELVEHDATEHANKRPLTHTCEICKMEFHFKYKLDEHMFEHTGEKAHSCQKCPQKFVSRKDLDRHMMEHQQEVSFRCNTCEKTFSTIDELQRHVRLHTGNAKYTCSLCHATFRWKSQLTSHMVVHSADRDFKCTFCARKFKRKRDLIRHVKIYHDTKPPYTCTECNKDLHSPYNLMLHKTETHWKETEVQPGQFPCSHCTGVFGLNSDLQRHLIKVHPPRPNICLLCMKRFTLFKFLQRHFELKHEDVEMQEGTNYEIKEEESNTLQEVEEKVDTGILEEVGGLEMDVENIDNNQKYDDSEDKVTEDMADKEVLIAEVDQQGVDGVRYQTDNSVTTSFTEMTNVPIPEAITLAQFSQQGAGEDIFPVFLQENSSILQQPQVSQEVVSVPAVSSLASSYKNIVQVLQPQVVSISQPRTQAISVHQVQALTEPQTHIVSQPQPQVASIPQPQVVSIPQPQVVSIPQSQVVSIPQIQTVSLSQQQAASLSQQKIVSIPRPQVVEVQRAAQKKIILDNAAASQIIKTEKGTPVKIPLVNRNQPHGGHIVVQQGKGPNKKIKIISMDLSSVQSVAGKQVGSLTNTQGNLVTGIESSESQHPGTTSESVNASK